MLLVVQQAVLAADHHGNLAEMHIGEQALSHNPLATFRVINECRADTDIHEQGRRISQVTETGVIRHHG